MEVGGRRYVARLLSYPTVCVSRPFLDAALARLAAAAEEEVGEAGGCEAAEAPEAEALRCARAPSPCASIA